MGLRLLEKIDDFVTDNIDGLRVLFNMIFFMFLPSFFYIFQKKDGFILYCCLVALYLLARIGDKLHDILIEIKFKR